MAVVSKIVDIPNWVDGARANRREYRRRQVVEVLIETISSTEDLKYALLLKGGTLMALAYGSTRATTDIDFTATSEDQGNVDELAQMLDDGFPAAARKAGYPRLLCRVQKINKKPPRDDATFPTYEVRIGSAEAGTDEQRRLEAGQAVDVARLEISFNEFIGASQEIYFESDKSLLAYSPEDLIAEKIRAYLQQETRNRRRRQDIYDLSILVEGTQFDADFLQLTLDVLINKCHSRDIFPDIDTFDDEALVDRARSEYHTIQDEVRDQIVDFARDFDIVRDFYRSLPWDGLNST